MKPKVVIAFLTIWLLGSAGCYGPAGRTSAGRPLPPEVAGTWQARDSAWRIILSRQGNVSSAVIPMGEVEIRPKKTTRVEMKDGSFSTYMAGDCVVNYTAATRELFVSIEMKKIRVVYMDNVVDGNSIDRFVGPVSADGKVWTPDLISVFDYGPRFPQGDIFAQPLVFEKVED